MIIVAYIFIHCIVNNSLKYFTANWNETGSLLQLAYQFFINWYYICFFQSFGNIVSLKHFLEMIANGLFIESIYFNIRTLTLSRR